MKTLSKKLNHLKELTYRNPIIQFLYDNPFVKDVKPDTGDNYRLSLGIDKDGAAIFFKYLNASNHIKDYEYFNEYPLVILSIHIPKKDTSRLLGNMKTAFHKLSDYLAYKRFKADSKFQIPTYHLADWLTDSPLIKAHSFTSPV